MSDDQVAPQRRRTDEEYRALGWCGCSDPDYCTRFARTPDSFDNLPMPWRHQALEVAELLVHSIGGYRGSRTDALGDATAIVLAMRFSPEGDNHHNAAICPYCTPRPA